MKGSRTNLKIQGLDNDTALISPVLLQRQNQALKGGSVDCRCFAQSVTFNSWLGLSNAGFKGRQLS